MQAIEVQRFTEDVTGVHPTQVPRPDPGTGGILIKTIAAGVNYVDQLYIRGLHQNNRSSVRPPFILGLEFSGIVVQAPDESSWSVGDRVFGPSSGAYSEYIVRTSEHTFRKIPAGYSFEEAAVLAGTFPVAYKALVLEAGIKAGDTVLIHTASGGLGVAAVQVAASIGCRVLGTASSEDKCDFARTFGAEACFDSANEDWTKSILAMTNGAGVDVVFDPAGRVTTSLKCLARGGTILVVGFTANQSQIEKVSMGRVLMKQAKIIGFLFGDSLDGEPKEQDRIWNALLKLIDQHQIRPFVTKVYDGLDKVGDAMADLNERKIKGKAVVKVAGM